jgi:nicotinamidase-related amidase
MQALLVIDMLRDFVEADGALPVPGAAELIDPINREIRAFRQRGEPILFICDSHDPDDREFTAWPRHAVAGTRGAEIVPELDRREEDPVIEKKRYSAFYETRLEEVLTEGGVDTLVLTGVLTDICVLHSAVDAAMRDYRVVVLEKCTRSATEERHRWALDHIRTVVMEAEVR